MASRNPGPGKGRTGLRGLPVFSGETGRMLGMGLELGLLIGGLGYAGYWLDQRYDTAPWLAFTGIMLAMVGGTYNLAKLLLKPPGRKARPQPPPRARDQTTPPPSPPRSADPD